MRSHFINESVEAGLVVTSSGNWDDEAPPTPPAPKRGILSNIQQL